jgi:AcrR family transcriptional regulator
MGRAERRDQLLTAATQAFTRSGFAATSLDDIAAVAGVSRVILYRHFASKTELYRAVLDRACARLTAAVREQPGAYTDTSVDALIAVAADDPDAFRLMFHHAAREPEFRAEMDRFRDGMVTAAQRQLNRVIRNRSWAKWAAQLSCTVAIEATIAWLDAGQPDRKLAAERVRQAVNGVIQAAGVR